MSRLYPATDYAKLENSDTISGADDKKTPENEVPERQQDRRGSVFNPAPHGVAANKTVDKIPPNQDMLELPVTLPSLKIAVVRVPAAMSESDYAALVNSLAAWKPALMRKQPDEDEPISADHYMKARDGEDAHEYDDEDDED